MCPMTCTSRPRAPSPMSSSPSSPERSPRSTPGTAWACWATWSYPPTASDHRSCPRCAVLGHREARTTCGGCLVEGDVGLALPVDATGRVAGTAAHRAVVVRLAQAVAHRQLAPVVGVDVLLQLVRPGDRAGRADLVDPLAVVGRAGLRPRTQAPFLEQPVGVLAQAVAVHDAADVEQPRVREPGLVERVADRAVDRGERGVVRPVGVLVPHATTARALPRPAGLVVAELRAVRDRVPVGLHDDRV